MDYVSTPADVKTLNQLRAVVNGRISCPIGFLPSICNRFGLSLSRDEVFSKFMVRSALGADVKYFLGRLNERSISEVRKELTALTSGNDYQSMPISVAYFLAACLRLKVNPDSELHGSEQKIAAKASSRSRKPSASTTIWKEFKSR